MSRTKQPSSQQHTAPITKMQEVTDRKPVVDEIKATVSDISKHLDTLKALTTHQLLALLLATSLASLFIGITLGLYLDEFAELILRIGLAAIPFPCTIIAIKSSGLGLNPDAQETWIEKRFRQLLFAWPYTAILLSAVDDLALSLRVSAMLSLFVLLSSINAAGLPARLVERAEEGENPILKKVAGALRSLDGRLVPMSFLLLPVAFAMVLSHKSVEAPSIPVSLAARPSEVPTSGWMAWLGLRF